MDELKETESFIIVAGLTIWTFRHEREEEEVVKTGTH